MAKKIDQFNLPKVMFETICVPNTKTVIMVDNKRTAGIMYDVVKDIKKHMHIKMYDYGVTRFDYYKSNTSFSLGVYSRTPSGSKYSTVDIIYGVVDHIHSRRAHNVLIACNKETPVTDKVYTGEVADRIRLSSANRRYEHTAYCQCKEACEDELIDWFRGYIRENQKLQSIDGFSATYQLNRGIDLDCVIDIDSFNLF